MGLFDKERRRDRRAARKRRRAERKRNRADRAEQRANKLDPDLSTATAAERARITGLDSQGRRVVQEVEIDLSNMRREMASLMARVATLEDVVRDQEEEIDELQEELSIAEDVIEDGLSGFLSPQALSIFEAAITTLNASAAPQNPWALSLSEIMDTLVDLEQAAPRDVDMYRLVKAVLKGWAYYNPETGLSGLLGNAAGNP